MPHGKDLAEQKQVTSTAYVSKQFVLNKVEGVAKIDEEILKIHRFATEPAWVDVTLGVTINLGNYESARLDVGVKVPCYKEEADDAYTWAKDWAADRIKAEAAKIKDKTDTSII